MGLAHAKLSAAQYVTWESAQATRHHFIAGDVFAMAGGTAEHNAAALSVAASLRSHLRGTPCKVFMGDLRVHVERADAYFYPDVVVTCDPTDLADAKATQISAPRLIVEVLSPATASFDRGQKFAFYRSLPSLMEYVLIDPDLRTVEVFRKTASATWELHPMDTPEAIVALLSVDWHAPISTIFE